jgi:hypothetical protein
MARLGQAPTQVLNTPIVVKDAQGLPVGGVLIQISDSGSGANVVQGLTAANGIASIAVPVAAVPSGYFILTPTKRGVSFDPPSTSYDVYTDQGSVQATSFVAKVAPIPVKAVPLPRTGQAVATQIPMNLQQYMPLIYLGGAVVLGGLLILALKPSKKTAAPAPAPAAVADAIAMLRRRR